jgi:excinuclease UvrABC nuclease subunit
MGQYLAELETKMRDAARKFDFKQAAAYRDRIQNLKNQDLKSRAGMDDTIDLIQNSMT